LAATVDRGLITGLGNSELMKVVAIFLWLVRLAGLTAIVLGLTFWSGHALNLVPVHMLVGIVLVLSLWSLASIAAFVRVHSGLVIVAFVWCFVVPTLGLMQDGLVPGGAHWTIRLLHLFFGLIAIGLGEVLAWRLRVSAGPLRSAIS
jgi:hypothetical protein